MWLIPSSNMMFSSLARVSDSARTCISAPGRQARCGLRTVVDDRQRRRGSRWSRSHSPTVEAQAWFRSTGISHRPARADRAGPRTKCQSARVIAPRPPIELVRSSKLASRAAYAYAYAAVAHDVSRLIFTAGARSLG